MCCLELGNIISHFASLNHPLFLFYLNIAGVHPNVAGFLILVVAVQATWMAYDMVVMRTNPDLANSMRRLEDAFLNCKEEMEKNWQEMLKETKDGGEKKE